MKITELFRRRKPKGRQRTPKSVHKVRHQIAASDGAYRALLVTKEQYKLTLIGALDLLAAKGIQKLVEEKEEKLLSPRELQLFMARTIAEFAVKAKSDAPNAPTPRRGAPGGSPGAASH